MILNGHFGLNSVLRWHVWSSEDWLSKLGYTLKLIVNVVGNFKTKTTTVLSQGKARFSCFLSVEKQTTIVNAKNHYFIRLHKMEKCTMKASVHRGPLATSHELKEMIL